ncbi:hypothetical protein F4777DRAFT_384677 [Nemania sp. FL0916]|nr:hypothetical protein F4777DRAFT_384677 [Nemania sp. FL0916]
MERKRKLPARAAARGEHVSKKRNSTPPDISTTPTPSSALTSPQRASSAAQEPPPTSSSAALPKSVQPGQPLPTVEKPQADDLSNRDFQSVQESGVIAEALARSRQKWIHDGVFEKYWTKPTKRKGVVKEDANNPAKDTMTKIGPVTLTVEPHLLEATLYAVKEPKPAVPSNPAVRPVIQYGPPNGAMPPPPKPTPVTSVPTSAPASAPATATATATAAATATAPSTMTSHSPAARASPAQTPGRPAQPAQSLPPTPVSLSSAPSVSQQMELQRPQLPAAMDNPVASPRGLESVLAAPQPAHAPVPGSAHSRPPQAPLSQHHTPPAHPHPHPLHAPNPAQPRVTGGSNLPPVAPGVKTTPPPPPPKPAQAAASGADPIIVTLAERASEDQHLRDLMKRVAVGGAAPHELAHFQRIIDQITLDYKRKGSAQPSASQLFVDGRSVKYFADEVKNISAIVLASNPAQRSSELRSPPGCDPLVLLCVKETLDKPAAKALCNKVADERASFGEIVEFKNIVDRLLSVVKFTKALPSTVTTNPLGTPQPAAAQVKTEEPPKPSPNPPPASQQALRSKGPPPSAKPDIAAVVLEFAGGTGDRYLFPKYSILEYSADGTEVVASFLIVRRGSKLEHGGDRALDYYQPITLRLHSQTPKVLEHLARVVAPQNEVQRYMDDVMDNMTRAEYVLLAMRLPRVEREDPTEEHPETPKASEVSHASQMPGVLWDAKPTAGRPASAKPIATRPTSEDEQYQTFIGAIS